MVIKVSLFVYDPPLKRSALTHSWLEIYENGSWDVMLVICLVEEDILAVTSLLFGGILFESTVLCDTMLATEMLPEVRSDLVTVVRQIKGQFCT